MESEANTHKATPTQSATTDTELKEHSSSDVAANLLQEASVLKALQHPRLPQLFGVCSVASEGPVYVVTELMDSNLLHHLRNEGGSLKLPQLVGMAMQVAEGMTHLEQRSCVHCQLRASCVLVRKGDPPQCKISGLSRAQFVTMTTPPSANGAKAPPKSSSNSGGVCQLLYRSKYPLKWTAPEAALHNRFSTKSDVWSFGVTLYEVVTLGGEPYPLITLANQWLVLEAIHNGFRIPRPEACPKGLYEVMLKCWNKDAGKRPSFLSLFQELKRIQHNPQ